MLSNSVFKIKLKIQVGSNRSGSFSAIMKRADNLQIYLFFFKFGFDCFTALEAEINLTDVTINLAIKN